MSNIAFEITITIVQHRSVLPSVMEFPSSWRCRRRACDSLACGGSRGRRWRKSHRGIGANVYSSIWRRWGGREDCAVPTLVGAGAFGLQNQTHLQLWRGCRLRASVLSLSKAAWPSSSVHFSRNRTIHRMNTEVIPAIRRRYTSRPSAAPRTTPMGT